MHRGPGSPSEPAPRASARRRSGGRSPRRPRRPSCGYSPTGDLVEVVADARQLPRALALHVGVRHGPGVHSARATGAPDPTASSLRSAPWRATRHAPRRWRGPSPKRRVRRSRRAVAFVGVRGGTAPRQPLRGTRGVWPRRVGWLSGESGVRQARPPQPRTLRLNAPHRPTRLAPSARPIPPNAEHGPPAAKPRAISVHATPWLFVVHVHEPRPLCVGGRWLRSLTELNCLLQHLHARNGEGPLARRSTLGKCPNVSGRLRTFQNVS